MPSGTATEDADTAPIITADNTDFLAGAGKTLDLLSCEAKDASHTETFWQMNPRTILTLKSKSAKAVHITEFLTEQSKRRHQAKRREFIIKTGAKDSESLIFNAEDDHPYLGIYIEEWGQPICVYLTTYSPQISNSVMTLNSILLTQPRYTNLQRNTSGIAY